MTVKVLFDELLTLLKNLEGINIFATNPDVIMGNAEGSSADNVRNAYKWSFLHWGIGAWACYALVGLALAYFSYRRNLPLTIRSALVPLFGRSLSGTLGHVVDIVAVAACLTGRWTHTAHLRRKRIGIG